MQRRLLAKLIQQGTANDSHLKNFKRFFSAKYAIENEEGDLVTPAPKKIAPQALTDSFIPTIEEGSNCCSKLWLEPSK